MPAVGDREREAPIEVLVTGFGPFGRVAKNPSFLCTSDLHDTYLDTVVGAKSDDDVQARKIHVQVIQTSVSYAQLLDLVPRIHGRREPASPEAKAYLDPQGELPDAKTGEGAQGNGSPFPQGYRTTRIPAKGYFDHVVHVGVGLSGSLAIETLAHKRGYQLGDVKKEKAPVCTDQSPTQRRDFVNSAAEENERKNMEVNGRSERKEDDPIRGFGRGYEQFPDELSTVNDTAALVHWLQDERGHQHVRQSLDAGRFLCDYIFYCSLAESQRAGHHTKVQFIHVPPEGQPYTLSELQSIVKDAISWLAS